MISKILFTILLTLLPLHALAVNWETLRVESKAHPTIGFLGDPFRLDIVIDHDKEVTLYYPEETYDFNPFQIIKMEVVEGAIGKDLTRVRIAYIFTTYNVLGEAIVPPVKIVAKDNYGKKKIISIENHKVWINRLTKEEHPELVDIYIPMEPEKELPLGLLAYILAGVLAFALFLFFVVRYTGKKSGKGAGSNQPREKALDALSRLKINKAEKKVFYFQLSGIFRLFVEEHLHVPALRSTSTEILTEFKKRNLQNGFHEEARELFFDLDLVKFSSFDPSITQMENAFLRTDQLIRKIP